MAVGKAYVFPGFLTPVLTQLFFPKPPTTFLTCFCRGERRKYAGKKSRLNRGSNSQPTGHESHTLTTEPHGWGLILGLTFLNTLLRDGPGLVLHCISLKMYFSTLFQTHCSCQSTCQCFTSVCSPVLVPSH